ncbi:zinc-binding dehydrogenase, partial [Dehalococcoidia bacterium]|nr:zinc-binding dehydrogenase [Dehalococcoidia bacterium]
GNPPSLPFTPGWEVAGVIEAVGVDVHDRHVGQRVVATLAQGGYAELVAVNRAGTIAIPDDLSLEDASSIPMVFLTSWYALIKVARLGSGEVILVQSGGSGVGVAAIQIGKYLGARILTTAGTDDKAAKCKALGAEEAVNYTSKDFLEAAMRFTDGRGVDVVLESVGGEVMEKSIDALVPLGRLVTVGNSSRSSAVPDLNKLAQKNVSFCNLSLARQMGFGGVMSELAQILKLCSEGVLTAVVDRTFPISQAAEAHRYVSNRKNFGKVLLIP